MVHSGKPQRIRDPIHDLIIFESSKNSQLEGALWRVTQTRAFQRLRRVKQLGFSDLVYPGATHSRFAHSIGVFHTARMLMEIVRRHLSYRGDTRENHALAAALVHDVGHGPFSHAFEKVGERLGLQLANHETLSEQLVRNGEIAEVLNKEMGTCFSDDVADIIRKDGVKTVHHAVVSSQFDADRLDYIRRDRFMAGSQHAVIDFHWLLANLEIGEVSRNVDDTPLEPIETFVIGPKAVQAAEAYVLGLFHLYPTVYFHKATRGAEKLFEELLVRVVNLLRDGAISKTGLDASHPLVKFAADAENPETALQLDDSVIWGALPQMIESQDVLVSDFARRLRDRKLFRCFDIRESVAAEIDPKCSNLKEKTDAIDKCCASINARLTAEVAIDPKNAIPVLLVDQAERPPYKQVDRSKGPLNQIMVRTNGNQLVDLGDQSVVVKELKSFKLLRSYFDRRDHRTAEQVEAITREETKKWR